MIKQDYFYETLQIDRTGQVIAKLTLTGYLYLEDLGKGIALEMVSIPGGSFQMGSPVNHGYEDEHPQHFVNIQPFLMSKAPITQAQWLRLMRPRPWRFKDHNRPVENVSWHQAVMFCEKLSKRTGRQYTLPSESQWEYACRAGTTGDFSFGPTLTSDVANYNGKFTYRDEPEGIYRHETNPAGDYPPNSFGLHDMHGGLWEWCADHWHDDYIGAPSDGSSWIQGGDQDHRITRGGSWHDTPDVCRSAVRLKFPASAGEEIVGFRVSLLCPIID